MDDDDYSDGSADDYQEESEDEGYDYSNYGGYDDVGHFEEDNPHINDESEDHDRLIVSHIPADEIVQEMDREIQRARNVIERSYTSTRLLLSAYNWDTQKCIDTYFAEQAHSQNETEAPPPEKKSSSRPVLFGFEVAQSPEISFFQIAYRQDQLNSPISKQSPSQINSECLICYIDITICPSEVGCVNCSWDLKKDLSNSSRRVCSDSNALRIRGCSHVFCKDCVIQYLKTKIVDVGRADRVLCPEGECKNVIDDELIIQLLLESKASQAVKQYKQLMANGYIQKNRLMRWCPSPECDYALKADQNLMKKATCVCGKEMCFKCGRDWHDPMKCELLEKWVLKYTTDSENAHYIVANTKPCPKCNVNIEKNGGCNHMSCKSCQYSFCWSCMESWDKHGQNWYNCTRYTEDSQVTQSLEISRQRLKRFVHYGGRYDTHTSSLRKVPELREAIKTKIESMTNDCRLSYVDTKFLDSALEALQECRKVLAYTYAFAYYLASNNQKFILENNQKDLEYTTENLNAALERDLAEHPFNGKSDAANFKAKVQNDTSYCRLRAKKLLEHVKEGYEQNLWEFEQSYLNEKVRAN